MKLYNIYLESKHTSCYYKGNLVTPSLILQNVDGFDIKKRPINIKKIHKNGGKIYRKDDINNVSRDFRLRINNSLKKKFNFWAFYFEVKKYEQDPDWNDIESDIYSFIMKLNINHINIYYIINGLHDTYNQHIKSEEFTTKLSNELNEKDKFLVYLLIYIIKCKFDNMNPFDDFYISKHDKSSITHALFLSLRHQLIDLEKGLNNYLETIK